jgi:hypothetical protein
MLLSARWLGCLLASSLVLAAMTMTACKPKPPTRHRFSFELKAAHDAALKGANSFDSNLATFTEKLGPSDEHEGDTHHWYGSGRGAGAAGSECAASCCELVLRRSGASFAAAPYKKCGP